MKLTKLLIAIATFATITLSSSAYIATKEVTSAVLVDKAKHSLDLTTNGLHNISVSEAFTIDKSEAAQINFLRCSFARPEFRFSWFCHQQKIDGKMTKNSYVALKDDQQKYFKANVFKSIAYEARKLFEQAEQLSTLAKIQRSNKNAIEKAKASGVNGEARAVDGVEHGGSELMKAGTQTLVKKQIYENSFDPILEFSTISIPDIIERFESSNSPTSIKDFEPVLFRVIASEQSKEYRVGYSSVLSNLGLVAVENDVRKQSDIIAKINKGLSHTFILVLIFLLCISIQIAFISYNGEDDLKKKVRVLRKRRYKLLKTAKPFSKEAAEISELDIKIEELDNKLAKLKDEVKGENHE